MLKSNDTSTTTLSKLTLLIRVVSAFLLILVVTHDFKANALDFTERSVEVGSSVASTVTTHDFRFTMGSGGVVGSIRLEYCDNTPTYGAPCTAPIGLDVSSANITLQSGLTGFTIDAVNTTANQIVLTRTPTFTSQAPVEIFFNNITNQSAVESSVFVRISTHLSTDGAGPFIDSGAVAYYTVEGIGVGGYVPPFLIFCAGVTVSPDCSTTAGSLITLGEFSQLEATVATSQLAVATNGVTGYNLFLTGGTMTSGNEVIPELLSNSASSPGTSQFGINLRANSSPAVGADVSGAGTGQPEAGYNVANSFRYNDGELLARSPLPTDFNRYTVSYMVNISNSQKPGIYASSYTFIAVASF